MNGNDLYIVKEYYFDKPLIQKIDSITDSCFKHCHNKCFHKFKSECIYDINLIIIFNIERTNLTIIGKNLSL